MKKVLFFLTPHFRMKTIFQIQTEILLEYVEQGYEIILVDLLSNSVLDSATRYISNSSFRYLYFKSVQKLFALLKKHTEECKIVSYLELERKFQDVFIDVDDLRNYMYEGVNIGLCASSTLISTYRDHYFDTKAKKKEVEREINVAINVFDTAEEYIESFSPDVVCFFNGRLSTNAPILYSCENRGVNYKTFEFTLRRDKYHLLNNAIPHNYAYRYKELLSVWDKEPNEKIKELVGSKFFESKYTGDLTVGANFLNRQKESASLEIKNKKLVTFFNSSLDEFVAVPGWEKMYSVFKNEYEAISETCKHFMDNKDITFVLRIHPNLSYQNNTQMKELKKLEVLSNLLVIPPTSEIFSYNLVKSSDLVIAFNSTIGIEACYLGKPVVTLAKTFYDNLDVAYQPNSEEEFYKLIEGMPLPKKKENTYKYGYWWMNFGTSFKFRGAENGYDENYYENSFFQKMVAFLLKVFSVSFIKTLKKSFFNKNIFQKLKNPLFRAAICRNVSPWTK